ncbi:MAG: two pore domain potassium channel family protein [Clostridia bacterium]|nr:two pore domain potassium channel family protein [Clostridia bacterium]
MGKKRRRTLRLLKDAFKTAGADKIFSGYILWFFISAVPIWLWEPNINTYQDSLWFCFASATTIGYGDVSAVTLLGRIITVFLSIYSIGVVAIFTAVVASFFTDIARLKASDSAREFSDDLEHLSELSKEELEQLSQRIKEYQKKNH